MIHVDGGTDDPGRCERDWNDDGEVFWAARTLNQLFCKFLRDAHAVIVIWEPGRDRERERDPPPHVAGRLPKWHVYIILIGKTGTMCCPSNKTLLPTIYLSYILIKPIGGKQNFNCNNEAYFAYKTTGWNCVQTVVRCEWMNGRHRYRLPLPPPSPNTDTRNGRQHTIRLLNINSMCVQSSYLHFSRTKYKVVAASMGMKTTARSIRHKDEAAQKHNA